MAPFRRANALWDPETNYFSELTRIDGKPIEFEWKIFPGFTTAGILNEIQKMMGELQCDPADFKDRIIFMLTFNDIVWDARGNDELCENNSKSVAEYARQFLRGDWSFLGLGSEQKWYGTCAHTPCRTRIFLTHSLSGVQTSRTRVAQGVCSGACHTSPSHPLHFLMFHLPCLLFPHGHFDTSFPSAPSLPELFPIRKRGSSALPHERPGVWLPG